MAIQDIGSDEWQLWRSNVITQAYFKDLADQRKEVRKFLERICTEQNLARDYFQRKGTIEGLSFAIDRIDELISESKIEN